MAALPILLFTRYDVIIWKRYLLLKNFGQKVKWRPNEISSSGYFFFCEVAGETPFPYLWKMSYLIKYDISYGLGTF